MLQLATVIIFLLKNVVGKVSCRFDRICHIPMFIYGWLFLQVSEVRKVNMNTVGEIKCPIANFLSPDGQVQWLNRCVLMISCMLVSIPLSYKGEYCPKTSTFLLYAYVSYPLREMVLGKFSIKCCEADDCILRRSILSTLV